MASSDQRDNERVPTFLRVRLKFSDVDTFIDKYSTNVSLGGIFIQSRSPKPPGTVLRFELALESGESLIRGEGQVSWVKEFDANAPGQPFGMGVRFTNLDAKSRALVERAVARRQNRAGPAGEPGFSPTPPPVLRTTTSRPERVRVPTPGKDLQGADADLSALMREAGLTEERVARAAAGVRKILASDDLPAGLLALLGPGAPAAMRLPSPPPVPPARKRGRTPVPVEPSGPRAGRHRGSHATPAPGPESQVLAAAQAPVTAQAQGEPAMDELDEAIEAALTPAPIPEDRVHEIALDFDRAAAAGDDLEGADLASMVEGLSEPPEITAVGTPPRFEESPEDEPPIFPDREIQTPPPESAPPLFSEDAVQTPPQAAPAQSVDRWAAASGPETENLDAELLAALDSVIDHSATPTETHSETAAPAAETADGPAPPAEATSADPASRPTPPPPHEPEKKGKSLLGRLFRKKN